MALDGPALGAAIGAAIIAKMSELYPPKATKPPQTQAQLDAQAAAQAAFYNGLGAAIGTSVTAYLKAHAAVDPGGNAPLPSMEVGGALVSGYGSIT